MPMEPTDFPDRNPVPDEQRRAAERRYHASEWHGRTRHSKRGPRDFDIEKWTIPGWMLQRMRRDDLVKPKVVHSIWRNYELSSELIAIDALACPSVEAAHDRLIEALARNEADAMERHTGKQAIGDVAFVTAGTAILFARANLIVQIRNLGAQSAPLEKIAQQLDKLIEKPGPVRK
jgi:hypothetical protein